MRRTYNFWLTFLGLAPPLACEGSLGEAGLGAESGGAHGEVSSTLGGALAGAGNRSGGASSGSVLPLHVGGRLAAMGGATNVVGGSVGSGGEGGEPGEATTPRAFDCLRPLGGALSGHACLHARLGPFEATLASQEATEGPWLERPHTAYQVASQGDYGWVRYRAPETGFYAVFLSHQEGLYRALPEGIPVLKSGYIGTCNELGASFAFSALADQEVQLEVGTPSIMVVEPMVAFGEAAWGGSCECALPAEACGTALCCEGSCLDGRCPGEIKLPACSEGLRTDGEVCTENYECCSGVCNSMCVADPICRSSGPCTSDDECCLYCHDGEHCH
jgi:hypothetical protein